MIITIEEKKIFKNKYIELQNNIVKDSNNKIFNHIKLIENNSDKPGCVVLCKHKNKFLLIENYRYGTDEFCLELPRGYVEENESLDNCAIRELYEETNITFDYNLDSIFKLGEISVNSAILASKVTIYLINIHQKVCNLKLQNDENIISSKWSTLKEIYFDISNNKITDGFTLSTLIYYKLFLKTKTYGKSQL